MIYQGHLFPLIEHLRRALGSGLSRCCSRTQRLEDDMLSARGASPLFASLRSGFLIGDEARIPLIPCVLVFTKNIHIHIRICILESIYT